MTSEPTERVFRIGISGSYGGLNLGDEAILQAVRDVPAGDVQAELRRQGAAL